MFSNLARATAVVLVAVAASASSAGIVHADGVSDHYVTAVPGSDGTSVVVGAGYSSSGGASSGASESSSSIHCTYLTLTGDLATVMGPGPNGATDGSWVLPYCSGGPYVNPMRPVWVSNVPTTASPATVARQAAARLSLPQATVRMSPNSSSPQLVGERTWLWVDPQVWRTIEATASVGAVSATATATPTQVIWNMGGAGGNRVVCNGPGVPYDPSKSEGGQDTSCTYVWPRGSATEPGGTFTVSATIVWRVTWTAAGAPGGGSLGPLSSPPSQVSVQVTDGDALNTGS